MPRVSNKIPNKKKLKNKLELKKEINPVGNQEALGQLQNKENTNGVKHRASFFSQVKPRLKSIFGDQKNFTRVIFILAIAGVVSTLYFLLKFNELKQHPSQEIDKQKKDLISMVSKLVVLPQDETPTIATVTNPEELKDQPFFANAKKGYKVLIYSNAKKAILYDPIANKIIEIAPINLGKPPL